MLADQARKATLCEVVWDRADIPETLVKGESFTTAVTFSNSSEHDLACSGDEPVRVAVLFQAVERDGALSESVPDVRHPLPADVEVGAAQTCHLVLQAPPTTGAYRLYVGIVKSQFVWSAAGLEGALVCTVSVQDAMDVEAVAKPLQDSYDVLMSPSLHAGAGPVRTLDADSLPPAAVSEDTPRPSAPDADFQESESIEKVVSDLDPPSTFALHDLTAFMGGGPAAGSKRLITSLNRIVFVEAGLPAHTPMDTYLDHFAELGLEGVPMHFLLENEGPVFQLLPLTANPLSYAHNWAAAIVLGVEGRAQTPAAAKAQLLRAARCCASILQAQAPYGASWAWEIGLDSVDGEIPFCNLALEDVAEVAAAMQAQWQLLGMPPTQLQLTPVVLPLEAKERGWHRGAQAAPPDPYFDAVRGSETARAAESGREVSEDDSEPPLWDPVPSRPALAPIDLQSDGASHIEYTYREKTAVFLWATGSRNEIPITQLNRLHALQFGDILYHFVIAPDGQIVETLRGPKPDGHLVPPLSAALHIGLQGDFTQQFPPEAQTEGCILLLARLARKEEQIATQVDDGTRPVTIGTEHWLFKDEWRAKVLHQTTNVVEKLRSREEGRPLT